MRFFVLVALFACGCAATIRDTSELQYKQDTFTQNTLTDGGLALLPVVAGEGQEGYRRPLADTLNVCIESSVPNLQFTRWQATMDYLNEHELATSYANAIATYQQTAIIDKTLLGEIGHAVGKRYLLFVQLQDFSKQKQTEYSFWTGWTTKEKAAVVAFAQIWDTLTGDVVWEAYGSAKSEGGELTYTKPYEEYSRIAARGLVKNLPGSTVVEEPTFRDRNPEDRRRRP